MLPFNFISIPRCASQSIHAALDTKKFNNHFAWHIAPQYHLYTFAVLREPIDRLKSWFFFHKNKYEGNRDVHKFYAGDFDRWVKNGFPHHWSRGACKSAGISSPLSQFDFIQSGNYKTLGPIKLLRFEHIEKDINSIAVRLQRTKIQLRRSGQSHKPSIEVSPKALTKIEDVFFKDIKLYAAVNTHMSACQSG